MANERGIIKLSRRQLYDGIWLLSVAGVARKYHLNYPRLMAACKEADIPYPASGYWTRKNMGKDVSKEVVPLKGDENKLVALQTDDSVKKRKTETAEVSSQKTPVPEAISENTTQENPPMRDVDDKAGTAIVPAEQPKEKYMDFVESDVLSFLEKEEREKVLAAAYTLEVNKDNRLHKVLVQYKKRVADYASELKKAQSREYYNPRVHKPQNEPEFFKEVSEKGTERMMAILDALFKAIEKLGGSVQEDLSVRIRSDIVQFKVAELQDKIPHELTKQEAQALIKYKDELKHNSWASKPQIRKYDHVYNGNLRITIGVNYIRDSAKGKLEDRLGDILIEFYEKFEENRIERERREAEQCKREEEARRREELRKRKETEIKRTKELANKAEDYRIAAEIRALIFAMIEKGDEEATPEWIEWAKEKADWYDPTVAREDEYLGKRDHGKDKSEKDPDKLIETRSWYW